MKSSPLRIASPDAIATKSKTSTPTSGKEGSVMANGMSPGGLFLAELDRMAQDEVERRDSFSQSCLTYIV